MNHAEALAWDARHPPLLGGSQASFFEYGSNLLMPDIGCKPAVHQRPRGRFVMTEGILGKAAKRGLSFSRGAGALIACLT